ncbi:GbsR/MarR family transcriptional regulator [Spirillospora sp. NPDC048911]|uniref:GbsR/MarR family transcriptional regulator n=1 Tax=Spirillospora sp. NPDC048911 TaxID=3364527 RepID=UPI003718C5F7
MTTPSDTQPPGARPSDGRTSDARPADPYDETLLRFVERFAIVLNESGMPRMPARVFAFVLADDAETYTAAELAAGLRVSPAAISSAVRHLMQTGLLGRERRRGERVDHYRVYDDDVWSAILRQREPMLRRNEEFLTEGAEMLDPARPGGHRVRETLEFYRFARAESPRMIERWQEHRRKHRLDLEAGEDSA